MCTITSTITDAQRTKFLLYANTAVHTSGATAELARTRPVRCIDARPTVGVSPSRIMHAARTALLTDLDGYLTGWVAM